MHAPSRGPTIVTLAATRAARACEMILPVIDRLQQTLDAENEQIASGKRIDYEALNQRKSQGLLELTRLAPMIAGAEASKPLSDALAALRGKLEANQRMLRIQLNAARKVADIIAKAIQDGQSDGTYSAYAWQEPDE
ncbi:MAG TPA: flagellar protein FlgN [Roseiarcus sp.]|nr:flagellar protein FlgN [Roseiarcus sp.]